jgi:hypothetical protein
MAISSFLSLLASDNPKDLSGAELSWPEIERRKNIALRRLRGILETEAAHTTEAENESGERHPQPLA